MSATLSAEPRFLDTPKWRGGIELVVGIAPDDASFESLGHFEDAGSLVGPDTRSKTIRGVVRPLYGFFWS